MRMADGWGDASSFGHLLLVLTAASRSHLPTKQWPPSSSWAWMLMQTFQGHFILDPLEERTQRCSWVQGDALDALQSTAPSSWPSKWHPGKPPPVATYHLSSTERCETTTSYQQAPNVVSWYCYSFKLSSTYIIAQRFSLILFQPGSKFCKAGRRTKAALTLPSFFSSLFSGCLPLLDTHPEQHKSFLVCPRSPFTSHCRPSLFVDAAAITK